MGTFFGAFIIYVSFVGVLTESTFSKSEQSPEKKVSFISTISTLDKRQIGVIPYRGFVIVKSKILCAYTV